MIVFTTYMSVVKTIILDRVLGPKLSSVIVGTITCALDFLPCRPVLGPGMCTKKRRDATGQAQVCVLTNPGTGCTFSPEAELKRFRQTPSSFNLSERSKK